jgi:hypothetical protein
MIALVMTIVRDESLLAALTAAETDDAALATASELIEELEPLPRRRLLASYAALGAPPRRKKVRRTRR